MLAAGDSRIAVRWVCMVLSCTVCPRHVGCCRLLQLKQALAPWFRIIEVQRHTRRRLQTITH